MAIVVVACVHEPVTTVLFGCICAASIHIFVLGKAHSTLKRKIRRLEKKETSIEKIKALKTMSNNKYWDQSLQCLKVPIGFVSIALASIHPFGASFFSLAILASTKKLNKYICRYITWFAQHKELNEQNNAINQEWIAFTKYLHEIDYYRQTPEDFFAAYIMYRGSKKTPESKVEKMDTSEETTPETTEETSMTTEPPTIQENSSRIDPPPKERWALVDQHDRVITPTRNYSKKVISS
jgi:hypothetical protein